MLDYTLRKKKDEIILRKTCLALRDEIETFQIQWVLGHNWGQLMLTCVFQRLYDDTQNLKLSIVKKKTNENDIDVSINLALEPMPKYMGFRASLNLYIG